MKPTMTRMKLVDILYDNHGFNRTEAKLLVDGFFEELCSVLEEKEAVKILGFGSFYVRGKKERIGRNPKTGQEYTIAPRKVVRFRASSKLREKINNNVVDNDSSNGLIEFVAE